MQFQVAIWKYKLWNFTFHKIPLELEPRRNDLRDGIGVTRLFRPEQLSTLPGE